MTTVKFECTQSQFPVETNCWGSRVAIFIEFRQSQHWGPRGWFVIWPLLSPSVKGGTVSLSVCLPVCVHHSHCLRHSCLRLFLKSTSYSFIYFFHHWFHFISLQYGNHQIFKTCLAWSITVNIFTTCAVMQCRLIKKNIAFKCIITQVEHVFIQMKVDMMFTLKDYPAEGSFRFLQFFSLNEWKAALRAGQMHSRMIHVTSSFRAFYNTTTKVFVKLSAIKTKKHEVTYFILMALNVHSLC